MQYGIDSPSSEVHMLHRKNTAKTENKSSFLMHHNDNNDSIKDEMNTYRPL
jgi:hypothetical protein